jgi:FixJ family two-component response regulator
VSAPPVVFIVDDDLSVRRATERLLRAAGFAVQAFASATEFLDGPRPDGPACAILDVRLPDLNGLDLQQRMAESGIDLPIIFMTGHGDIPMTVRAMKAGAVEFLTKPFQGRSLLDAIAAAIEKDRAGREARAGAEELRRRYEQLTPREREVMALVVRGFLNKQAAAELHTTERTIKFHRAHIMKKMRVVSVAELVQLAGKISAVK